jgi:hypothetical protein
MAKPLPLTVYGPITPISPAVRVTGVLPSADVTVLANGAPVGDAIAPAAGELWVPLTTQPSVGQQIAATQKTPDGTSLPSTLTIPVIDVPDPLPIPVIFSDLNSCMVDIWTGALVPGAKVITTIGGAAFGSATASQPNAWLGIDPSKGITPGSRAEVHQEATIGATVRVGKAVQSLPIPAFSVPTDQLPPPVLGPLTECDTFRQFVQVVPGAALTITNEGQSESWINPSMAYRGNGAPALRKGKAVAVQAMPRCRRSGQSATLPVGAAVPPLKPAVSQDICPQVMRLTVGNLSPGAILWVYRRVFDNPAGTSWSDTLVGELGIAAPIQPVDLPSDLALTDPKGPVSLVLWQAGCGGDSPETIVKVAPVSGPFGAPKIVEPLFDCARAIPVTGAHPSASVQAFDVKTGLPLSDSYPLWTADATIPLWFPLVAGERALVRQKGCNADGDSAVVKVQSLPSPLLVPTVVEPVRPHAPFVNVKGVIPGARLFLMVNNQLRPGAVDILADHGLVPVNGAPLAENDQVFVIQALCDRMSSIEGRGVTVKRGHLKVSVSPGTVARGTTASVVVTAVDADTGTPVTAQVTLNSASVGTTGVAFSYSPKAGDPNPAGVVHEPVAYIDATFTITLTDPHWTLAMQAGPLPPAIQSLTFSVDEVTWTVTPDWNTALAQNVVVHPSPPSATGSVSLPQPPGAVKTVTVTIAGKVSTAGGNVNGYAIPEQSFKLGTDTRKVTFHGPNERIGWLLQVHYVADGESILVTVDPTFVGITDF